MDEFHEQLVHLCCQEFGVQILSFASRCGPCPGPVQLFFSHVHHCEGYWLLEWVVQVSVPHHEGVVLFLLPVLFSLSLVNILLVFSEPFQNLSVSSVCCALITKHVQDHCCCGSCQLIGLSRSLHTLLKVFFCGRSGVQFSHELQSQVSLFSVNLCPTGGTCPPGPPCCSTFSSHVLILPLVKKSSGV